MLVRNDSPSCECTVVAQGVVAASLNALPALREQPGDSGRRQIPPRFLRHADEHTVVGLAAVLKAIEDGPLRETCFDGWGVVAAPMFPGRLGGAATFRRYQQGGPAAISPHIIPQNSLHSVSSAISISLAMHGPNFGIGGGPEALAEGLTVAMTLLDPNVMPGLWLVLTQWMPEPIPDGLGSTQTETSCLAVALGLQRGAGQEARGLTLSIRPKASRQTVGEQGSAAGSGCEPLAELAEWLAAKSSGRTAPWSYGLPWGGGVELVETQDLQRAKAA